MSVARPYLPSRCPHCGHQSDAHHPLTGRTMGESYELTLECRTWELGPEITVMRTATFNGTLPQCPCHWVVEPDLG